MASIFYSRYMFCSVDYRLARLSQQLQACVYTVACRRNKGSQLALSVPVVQDYSMTNTQNTLNFNLKCIDFAIKT